MRNKLVAGVGWTFLVLAGLGTAEQHIEATATLLLVGTVIYWGRKIEAAIKATKE